MKNYIDVKVTVWRRFHFAEEANMPGLVDLAKESDLDEVIDDELGFIESEILFETEEKLKPAGNYNNATIEIYEGGKKIWNNAS